MSARISAAAFATDAQEAPRISRTRDPSDPGVSRRTRNAVGPSWITVAAARMGAGGRAPFSPRMRSTSAVT
jgi:hypothetical protein